MGPNLVAFPKKTVRIPAKSTSTQLNQRIKNSKYPRKREKNLNIPLKKWFISNVDSWKLCGFWKWVTDTVLIYSQVISDEVNSRFTSKENSNVREIFRDIPSLFQLHQLICQSLDELNPDVTGNLLPSAFVNDKEIPFLNIYKSFMCRYASNYPALVSHWNKDKEFATLCRNIVVSLQTSSYFISLKDLSSFMGIWHPIFLDINNLPSQWDCTLTRFGDCCAYITHWATCDV